MRFLVWRWENRIRLRGNYRDAVVWRWRAWPAIDGRWGGAEKCHCRLWAAQKPYPNFHRQQQPLAPIPHSRQRKKYPGEEGCFSPPTSVHHPRLTAIANSRPSRQWVPRMSFLLEPARYGQRRPVSRYSLAAESSWSSRWVDAGCRDAPRSTSSISPERLPRSPRLGIQFASREMVLGVLGMKSLDAFLP